MNNKLNIALVQTDIVWENIDANLGNFSKILDSITFDVDLIVFPEMFTTGFTSNAEELAEKMNGETIVWMLEIARKYNAAIVGSVIISEDTSFYNRLVFVHPSGKIESYDKHHTFTLAKEHEVFTAGKKRLTVDFRGWRICPLICYDLRFPVWSRNTKSYDLLLYVASWPKIRIPAWKTLLKARAIENISYTLGVNRVGVDQNNIEYIGCSIVHDYLGNELTESNNEKSIVIFVSLDKEEQDLAREKLGFLNDIDTFSFQ